MPAEAPTSVADSPPSPDAPQAINRYLSDLQTISGLMRRYEERPLVNWRWYDRLRAAGLVVGVVYIAAGIHSRSCELRTPRAPDQERSPQESR